ncbi:DUF952 domain-containing protein [Vibrio splendidus]|uniref:DUF952 domain-containing protein n=1 Tax=Vibrio splendidus TaxID=29497 RepID=UPI000C836AFE|nr:DUF952 domain-containing protein [Vibrio splendidus]PMH66805.1 hypothetical protein BCU61_03475 [Vibrio splendidus]PMJ26289.1 hypothetical protein BCU26_21515 [Vibrio splendidus]
MLYHLLTESDYKEYQSTETYEPASLKDEGFIHLAYEEQLQKIVDCFFVGITQVYLLEIDKSAIAKDLRDEPPVGVEDDGALYPHLYSPLSKQAVIRIIKLVADSSGALKVNL